MAGRFIRAVLFDLGGTLMHAAGPWPPVLDRAHESLAETLGTHGLELDIALFRQRLE